MDKASPLSIHTESHDLTVKGVIAPLDNELVVSQDVKIGVSSLLRHRPLAASNDDRTSAGSTPKRDGLKEPKGLNPPDYIRRLTIDLDEII